jgi:hypothetical protein
MLQGVYLHHSALVSSIFRHYQHYHQLLLLLLLPLVDFAVILLLLLLLPALISGYTWDWMMTGL